MDFMGKVTRKRHTAEFKARVALEAIKGEQTLAEIGAKHGIHLTLVGGWKKAAIEGMVATFSSKAETSETAVTEAEVTKLHAKIGQLVVERDFLAKAFGR
jgi:transposase